MSVYDTILRAQMEQGNLGGKSMMRQLGLDRKEEKRREKKEKKEVAESKIKKHIKFTISHAEVFLSTDSNGLSDPYVIIRKKKHSLTKILRTPYAKETLKPNWDYSETVLMTDKSVIMSYFNCVVELWDHDKIKDDFIGSTKVTCNTTPKAYSDIYDVEILDPKNPKQVNAKLRFSTQVVFP
eukprot:TRINITY_DN3582_c0_g2_i1.p1 TRINITY_DN3582_c0_g2~~TRINITY_DN3582_c0_g2_i1.p1  ORF type:complete len:196 (-),score=27.25 TRINITY_DN3582_c0_g2_i1:21-566(-)